MELSTRYLGLDLRNPLVASASPLSKTVDGVRRLADAGVGAVVLYSLFEEQLRREAEENARLAVAGTESFAESLSYFPPAADEDHGPRRYLSLLERAAAAVSVPVIGSINGSTPGSWAGYARSMQDSGAAAIELNIYYLPGDPHVSGRDVEQSHLDILARVKDAVTVPVAVKLSPYFSATAEMARRLDLAGADGLVLFNRFLQPDIDPETLAVAPGTSLSRAAEARLPLTWITLLHGRIGASLAATTGVEGSTELIKYLLAGADVVMTASGGDGEHFVEACDEALVEDVVIGDRAGVDVDAQRTGVDVGEQRDIDRRADCRAERVLHPNPGAAEEHRHRDARDIACKEVDVAQDRADVPAWHQVERSRDPLGIGQRPLTAHLAGLLMDGADPRCRVDDADGHVEPHQRDPVATHLVAFGPQADRHRQVQVADRDTVPLVVPPQPACESGDEPVVQSSAATVGRLP
jgi:dihydroorotate dehydrogenase (fumarate)